jgi:hypothetical protein
MSQISDDKGGRRSGSERRQLSYFIHIPERRSGKDRRSGVDRRIDRAVKREAQKERREIHKNR